MIGQNPNAQQLQSAMQAHINEHIAYEYRKQMEQQLGIALPAQYDEAGEENHMDPEIEARLAPMLAQAAQRLLTKNQSEVAQQQAQQQAQDPLVQMQQQEMAIKQAAQKAKEAKDQADIALRAQKQQDDAKFKARQQEIEAARTIAQTQTQKQDKLMSMGVELLKHQSDQHHEKETLNKELYADALKAIHTTKKRGE